MPLFDHEENGTWLYPIRFERRLSYFPGFIASGEQSTLLHSLWESCAWKQEYIQLAGKEIPIPRLSAWYGSPQNTYTYSGISMSPNPYFTVLHELQDRVNLFCESRFDAVLANAYRDERDSVGWHADDEPELGDAPKIAALSFGETRDFCVRPKDKSSRSLRFSLAPGSLLFMNSGFQADWDHCLPKSPLKKRLRISLTFRRYYN